MVFRLDYNYVYLLVLLLLVLFALKYNLLGKKMIIQIVKFVLSGNVEYGQFIEFLAELDEDTVALSEK